MKTAFLFLIALVAMIAVNCWAWVSNAQEGPQCFPRTDLLQALSQATQSSVALGNSQNGDLEIFATTDGHKWSAIFNRPDGSSCIIGGGTDWQTSRPIIDPTKGDGI